MVQVRKRERVRDSGRPRAVGRRGKEAGGPPASPREAAGIAGAADALVNPELFKALGDPTRARIAACLCKCSRACGVSEIAECCSVDLSVVSRHLATLERAGVLEASKRGRTVFYRVRYAMLASQFRALAEAIEECRRACERGEGCCGEACGPKCGG